MPWYSKAEAAQYSNTSDAWTQLLADPYNTKPNNSVQFGGPTACGLPIDHFCRFNDQHDYDAGRDMAFQAYNHSILWANTGDVASLNRVIEILELWMIGPTTRMVPILTTYSVGGSNSISQYGIIAAFSAAYNIIKDEPSFTSEPVIRQWIDDFIATAWPWVDAANKEDWKIFTCIAGAAATGDTVFVQSIRDTFVTRLNSRFLADGRVKEDYLRDTGLSYSCYALEAINATCEIIFRQTGENLFTHAGLVLAHDYLIPYIVNPSTWPWQQTNTFFDVESRQYEFMNTRNPQSRWMDVLNIGRPYYVDTATGHVTLTSSDSAVLGLPEISNAGLSIQTGPSGIEAVITWDTTVPTTGVVTYGDTTAETYPPLTSTTLSTSHAVTLPALVQGDVYYYTIDVQDALFVGASTEQQSFVANVDVPPALGTYTDEFNAVGLDAQWTPIDPLNDGGSITAAGTQLVIFVPAGAGHDAWTGSNNSLRVTHPIPDEDFFVEFEISSLLSERFQVQGFLAQQDADNYIRFDFLHNGTTPLIHAGTVLANTGTSVLSSIVVPADLAYMRVKRTGDLWEQWYSQNGVNWTLHTSFTQALTISSAGLFAANAGTTPTPAIAAQFNYYRINQLPQSITISNPTVVTQGLAPNELAVVSWDTSDLTTGSVSYGTTIAEVDGVQTSPALSLSHSVTIPITSPGALYYYTIEATSAGSVTVTEPQASFATTAATTGTTVTVGTAGDFQIIQDAIDAADVSGGWYKIVLIDNKMYGESITFSPPVGTPSITNFVWLTSAVAARGDGTVGTGARIREPSPNKHTINVNHSFVFVEHVGIELSSHAASDEAVRINANAFDVLFSRCLISGDRLAGDQDGVYAGVWDMGATFDHCLFDGFTRAGVHAQGHSSSIDINHSWRFDHCNFVNCGDTGESFSGGISAWTSSAGSTISIIVNNTAVLDTIGGDDFAEPVSVGTVTWSGTNNASSDSSLTARGLVQGAQELLVLTDVTQATGRFFAVKDLTIGAENYQLLDDSLGNLAYGNAANRIGSEPDPRQDFSTDIVGAVRSQTEPSIGFSEYNAVVQNPEITSITSPILDASVGNSFTPSGFSDDVTSATIQSPFGDYPIQVVNLSNIIRDGDFATLVGWSGLNSTLAIVPSGVRVTSVLNGVFDIQHSQLNGLTVGQSYTINVSYVNDGLTGSLFGKLGTSIGSTDTGVLVMSTVGDYSLVFTATNTTHYLAIGGSSLSVAGEFFELGSVSIDGLFVYDMPDVSGITVNTAGTPFDSTSHTHTFVANYLAELAAIPIIINPQIGWQVVEVASAITTPGSVFEGFVAAPVFSDQVYWPTENNTIVAADGTLTTSQVGGSIAMLLFNTVTAEWQPFLASVAGATQNPVITNVVVSSVNVGTYSEATISWDTDIDATAVLSFGPTSAEESVPITLATMGQSQTASLTSLDPGQQYYFTITATSDSGGVSIAPQDSFVAEAEAPGNDIVYFDGAVTLSPKFAGQITVNQED